MDIFELALLRYTDFAKFEDLATEFMKLEGFSNIHKIGGMGDGGVDAEIVQHYQDETTRTVFQYSLQDNVSSKINDTIKKLNDNKIEFNELVIVTNQQVNNKQILRSKTRANKGVSLQIFDLTDLKAYLADNLLAFNRYFPNIDEQLKCLNKENSFFTESSGDILEKSMLKCSLIFSFNEKGREKNLQKHLFYKTLLAILAIYDEGKTEEELINFFLQRFNRIINPKDIREALNYLESEKWVNRDSAKFKATNKVVRKMSEGICNIESRTATLIKEVIEDIAKNCLPEKISKEKEIVISNNIKKVLNAYFRLYGTECCGEFNASGEEFAQADLTKIATKGLNSNLSEWVVLFLGQLFSKPTQNQKETLSLWAKCFMGMQLMKLDPMLSQFQLDKLRGKTFVLDTDFVLYSITESCKQSKAYKQIIDVLVKSGCNVVIPSEIVVEVANHAASAEGNYKYFKTTFGTIDKEIVEKQMNNIFVKDYYEKVMSKSIHGLSFNSYLENYYDKDDRENFMTEVINSKLKGVKIGGDFTAHDVITEPLKHQFVEKINEELMKTPKAQYRSSEDNYQLSKVDADLYLYVLDKNKDLPCKDNQLLWAKDYLMTNSTRAARCAKRMNFGKSVVTNPKLIYNLIDEIGIFGTSKKVDFVDLFANPFLVQVVSENWENLKALADKGVDLRGREIPRLKRDLEGLIHSKITNIDEITDDESRVSEADLSSYVAFAKEVEARGYKLVSSVGKLIDEFRKKDQELEEATAKLDAINSEIAKKTIRKRRYLENVGERAVKNLKNHRKGRTSN